MRSAFTIRLIVQATLRAARSGAEKFLMGAAPVTERTCSGAIYVFYDQVSGFSRTQWRDPSLVLGTVIAHEIGHLTLRDGGHTAEGLMRTSWDSSDWQRAASGFLLFSAPDSSAIGETIASCAAPLGTR